jgi:hypothetical protein
MTGAPFSKITPAEAIDDVCWFDAHPSRRYRARCGDDGFSLIRKSGDEFLQAFACYAAAIADTDAEIAPPWFAAVRPELSFPKANRSSRQAGVRSAGGRG